MTEGRGGRDEERCDGCLLRRVTLAALALYLAPVALVVLLIGGLGLACCAVARLVEGGRERPEGGMRGRLRRDGAATRSLAVPHLHGAARSRSPGR